MVLPIQKSRIAFHSSLEGDRAPHSIKYYYNVLLVESPCPFLGLTQGPGERMNSDRKTFARVNFFVLFTICPGVGYRSFSLIPPNTTLTPLLLYVIDLAMEVLFTAGEISEKIAELGEAISQAYQGSELFVVGVLKGGFMFMADLVRAIRLPIKIEFARLSSYGNADSPVHEVMIIDDIHATIAGKHVLIVDDIMDTGHSLLAFRKHLLDKGPASVKICTLIDKSERREASISPDYYGFSVSEGFVVGYGLDFAEDYRALPQLYVLDPDDRGNFS